MVAKRLGKPANEQFKQSMRADRRFITMFKTLFNMENRIRVLEGRQPVTAATFKAAIKEIFEAP